MPQITAFFDRLVLLLRLVLQMDALCERSIAKVLDFEVPQIIALYAERVLRYVEAEISG